MNRHNPRARFWLLAACLLASPLAAVDLGNADGSRLTVHAPLERIVTLAPHLTEMAYAAGAGEQLVATVEWSDYPPDARGLPRIGDAFRIDLEQLLEIKPGLVIAWNSGNPEAILSQIEKLGIPVWRTEIRSLDDIPALLEDIGRLLADDETATRAAREFRRSLDKMQRQYGKQARFRYFMQLTSEPLYTVNGEHLISRALAVCNGQNIFAELGALAPVVSKEAVLAAAPEVIFYSRHQASRTEPEIRWIPWLGKTRRPAIVSLDADTINRPGPRVLEGIREACEWRQVPTGQAAK